VLLLLLLLLLLLRLRLILGVLLRRGGMHVQRRGLLVLLLLMLGRGLLLRHDGGVGAYCCAERAVM